jgi:hypothetical protein
MLGAGIAYMQFGSVGISVQWSSRLADQVVFGSITRPVPAVVLNGFRIFVAQ